MALRVGPVPLKKCNVSNHGIVDIVNYLITKLLSKSYLDVKLVKVSVIPQVSRVLLFQRKHLAKRPLLQGHKYLRRCDIIGKEILNVK